MKYDVITIGDASEDIFIRPKGLQEEKNRRFISGRSVTFELGEKIPIEEMYYDIGGSACNTAVSLARQGLEASIIVAIGKDSAGEKILKRLKDELVDTKKIKIKRNINSNFSVIVNVGHERSIFVYRGIKDYSILSPNLSVSTNWIYLGPMGEKYQEVIKRLTQLSAEKNIKIAWNPGSHQIEKTAREFRGFLKNVKVLILNREEGLKFTHFPIRSNPEDIMRALRGFGPEIIIITDGKNGAYAYDGKVYYRIDALNQHRLDPTGAGDSFSGGVVGRFVKAESDEFSRDVVSQALKWGVVNSSSVVNSLGTQKGLLSEIEIEKTLKENPRLVVEIK